MTGGGPTPAIPPAPRPGVRALRLAAPVRRARLRHVRRHVALREKARRRGREVPVRLAPRRWERYFVTPLMVLWEGLSGVVVWLSEALQPPPRRVFPTPGPAAFLVVGHRGAPTVEVENTIPSFERALAEGANAVETDLCVTKDGEVVLWHDADPSDFVAFARQSGAEFDVRCRPVAPPEGHPLRRPVHELTLAEFLSAYGYAEIGSDRTLPVPVPRLEDLVAWTAGRPDLKAVVLDLKVPAARADLAVAARERLARALSARPCATRFLWLSAHAAVLDALRKAAAEEATALDVELTPGLGVRQGASAMGPAMEAGRAGAGLGRPRFTVGGWRGYARVVEADLRRLAARGGPAEGPPRLFCWTINRRLEIRRLLHLGVPGILTDRPAVLRREVERLGGRPG